MGWRQDVDLEALANELHDTVVAKEEGLSHEQRIQLRQLQRSLDATKHELTEVSLAFWRAIKKQRQVEAQLPLMVGGAFLVCLVLDFFGWWPKFDLIRAVFLIVLAVALASFWIRDELKIDSMRHTKRLLERDWSVLNQSSNWAAAAIGWAKDNEGLGDNWPDDHHLRSAIIFYSTRLALVDLVSDQQTLADPIWDGWAFYM